MKLDSAILNHVSIIDTSEFERAQQRKRAERKRDVRGHGNRCSRRCSAAQLEAMNVDADRDIPPMDARGITASTDPIASA
jgi:hypothetical protein